MQVCERGSLAVQSGQVDCGVGGSLVHKLKSRCSKSAHRESDGTKEGTRQRTTTSARCSFWSHRFADGKGLKCRKRGGCGKFLTRKDGSRRAQKAKEGNLGTKQGTNFHKGTGRGVVIAQLKGQASNGASSWHSFSMSTRYNSKSTFRLYKH